MKPGEDTLGEASQMLRDILQNKEKRNKQSEQHQQQQQQPQHQQQPQPPQQPQQGDSRDNNNTLKTFDSLNSRSPIAAFCTASDSDSHEMMTSLLRGKASSSKANSEEDNDARSESFHNISGDDSDLDSSYGGPVNGGGDGGGGEDGDDGGKEADGEQDEDDTAQDTLSPSDSKEAKRARVENILTTIRQSPQAPFDTYSPAAYQEMKRQKRKQPQPQQHDVRSLLAPDPKYRKVERLVLHEHIRQLHEQLHAVTRSFHHMAQSPSDDEERELTPGREGVASPLHDVYTRRERDPPLPFINGLSPRGVTGPREEEDLRQSNGKGVGDSPGGLQKDREGPGGHRAGLVLTAPLPSRSGLQHAALTLKSEIIEAVAEAVDTALSSVLEKHAAVLTEQPAPTQPLKAETQQNQQQNQPPQQQQQNQQSQQQQQQQHTPHPLCTPQKQPESFPLPLSTPRARVEREALKEAVSNAQHERGPELVVPFQDHLSFLERLGPGPRLPDKPLSAFEPLHRPEISSELIKPHSSAALPFPPHYPYSYMHPGLLPPVFPVEPEQTEALPLVVSNIPKKKRTKVTDTRLSPRAKTALLQDGPAASLVSMMGEMGERHPALPSPFPPHYLPPVLPTSVAITNPSLHRSDLFSFRFHDSLFDSRLPSPPVHMERTSPKSPLQDSMHGLLKNDVFDTSLSESLDGQNAQKISFESNVWCD